MCELYLLIRLRHHLLMKVIVIITWLAIQFIRFCLANKPKPFFACRRKQNSKIHAQVFQYYN